MGLSHGLRGLVVAASVCAGSAANAADLMPVKAPSYQPQEDWRQVFAGLAVMPNSWFADLGGVFAFNRNFKTDGWLFRIRGGDGYYSYFSTPGAKQSADFQVGEAMIGYQHFIGAARLTGYIGPYVERHENSNDPLAEIVGTRAGVRGQIELYTPINDRFFFFGQASATNVWNGYFGQAKIGYRLNDMISIGPELIALGNTRFDAVRFGPSVGFDFGKTQVFLSGGYSWDQRRTSINDDSGAYGFIHARTNF